MCSHNEQNKRKIQLEQRRKWVGHCPLRHLIRLDWCLNNHKKISSGNFYNNKLNQKVNDSYSILNLYMTFSHKTSLSIYLKLSMKARKKCSRKYRSDRKLTELNSSKSILTITKNKNNWGARKRSNKIIYIWLQVQCKSKLRTRCGGRKCLIKWGGSLKTPICKNSGSSICYASTDKTQGINKCIKGLLRVIWGNDVASYNEILGRNRISDCTVCWCFFSELDWRRKLVCHFAAAILLLADRSKHASARIK